MRICKIDSVRRIFEHGAQQGSLLVEHLDSGLSRATSLPEAVEHPDCLFKYSALHEHHEATTITEKGKKNGGGCDGISGRWSVPGAACCLEQWNIRNSSYEPKHCASQTTASQKAKQKKLRSERGERENQRKKGNKMQGGGYGKDDGH